MAVKDKDFFKSIGYPDVWLKEAEKYKPEDAHVIFDPEWGAEPIPEPPLISIYDLFRRTVDRSPQETAVVFLYKPITSAELDEMINRYASLLLDLGVGKGDVVAAMLPNSLQHWIAFYGANRIGAIHTPINAMYKADEIAYQINDSGAKVAVVLDLLYTLHFSEMKQKSCLEKVILTNIKDWANPSYEPSPALKMLWDFSKSEAGGTIDLFTSIQRYEPTDITVEIDPKEDVSLLLYTAGTTGLPKGVLETHFNLVFNSLSHSHPILVDAPREVNMSIMPMFHTAGYLLHTLPTFYKGGTVIPIAMFDAGEMLDMIQRFGGNTIFAPPTLFIALLQYPKFKDFDIGSLKVSIGCGAPVPVAVQEQWNEITGITLTNGWGMTEINCGGCISFPGKKEKLDSIGLPIAAEMKIVDEEGDVVKREETGEIMFRGLQVAKGYLNKPEETKSTFLPDGWLKTGDLGYIDDEDFVHFVDRQKDLIVASGYNIAPVEVENVLYQHPAVAEVAVVGIPHGYRGETVKAVIALKEDYKGKVSEQEIIDFCKEKLATFKVPRVIEIRDELPKSAVGKILRRVIREEAKKEERA